MRYFRWYRSGKLVASAAIASGIVAAVSPWLPLGSVAATPPITGIARIIDGDTIEIRGERIRLYGIDAPETRQICRRDGPFSAALYSCGAEAKAALARIIGFSPVACTRRGSDIYGRTIASCVAGTSDIGREMVRQGWAVAYTEYSLAYLLDEIAARARDRALWAGEFENPADWRRKNRAG